MLRIIVEGRVQGIGFRPFVYRIAKENNLNGYVRNMSNGTVEIVIEGDESNIKNFIMTLKDKSPKLSVYNAIKIERLQDYGFDKFSIIESGDNLSSKEFSIAPDLSICDECIKEMFNASNRRYAYFFITCTNCGPRFTMIEALPYDRIRTSMREFAMCKECYKEYNDVYDRRFHAESIACKECGPKLTLMGRDGKIIDGDPIVNTAELIDKGYIIAIKGIGGFHIAVSAMDSSAIARLRKGKDRDAKPFAVMAKDVNAIKEFAIVNELEEEVLTSYIKPIVILKKSESYYLSPLISELHTIGVMLPYTGLHYLLFDKLRSKVIVMTSANLYGPIMIDEDSVRKLYFIDYILSHNRRIVNRCDDSVVKVNDNYVSIIRRSRGYTPLPIEINEYAEEPILAIGAHMNLTVSFYYKNKIFVSQHIGDMDNIENYMNLNDTIHYMCNILNIKPKIIACDMHPSLPTNRVADDFAREFSARIVKVQHHNAHLSTLMLESDEDMIGIICDGVGYGYDGNIWGGEIILSDGFKRIAHLSEQPMIGGDLATIYPYRMVASILYDIPEVYEYLSKRGNAKEIDMIISKVRRGSYIKTSSMGRILDAAAYILEIVEKNRYEGEAAMLLEAVAINGNDPLRLEPKIDDNKLDTRYILEQVFYNKDRIARKDLAYSIHSYLARGLSYLAISHAKQYGIEKIGFSGGVAYNSIITTILKREIEKSGLSMIYNTRVPAGDAGLSIGQAYYANNNKHLLF